MDSYTKDTKSWLDSRFKLTDRECIYHAHEPIYGLRKGHSETGIISKYITTYQIIQALSKLEFTSLLDVGGAEGYKAALARAIFNVKVRSVDLSKEACKRSKEIYNVDGEQIDIHQLPYKDNAFDVVLCSETLEHVSDFERATRELLRICRKAVVITVPHESREVIENNIIQNSPHAHIHSLDINSFDFALPTVSKIISRRFHNPFLKKFAAAADAMKIEKSMNYPQVIVNMYNFSLPLFRLLLGRRSIETLLKVDDYISNVIPSYSGMIFILLRDPGCYTPHQEEADIIPHIIDFKVPYHYLR